MSKYYLIFGGIAGSLSAVLEYMIYSGLVGFDRMGGVLFGKILALLGCIIFAVVLIRKMYGSVSFLRVSFSGLMIALVCSAFSGIGYSMMHYPDGSFFNDAKEYTYNHWLETNKDNPEEMARKAEARQEIDNQFSLKYHSLLDTGMYLAIGLVFTAFFAGFIADRKSLAG